MKIVSALGQIVLAWFLAPGDLGLVGLASTVMVFAGLLQQGGIRQVLVQRQSRFSRWATPACWLSLAMGLVAAAVVVLFSPVAAHLYGEPKLPGLMLVMALGLPLDSLAVVPMAKLQIDLRFRTIAWLGFIWGAGTVILSVVLAKLGYGAYSVVLPKIPVALTTAALCWWLTRVRVRPRPQVRRWRYLLSDSGFMLLALFLHAVAAQVVYVALGLRGATEQVGLYWWAYNLSVQTVMLVSIQLDSVLFAALSRIKDDTHRQIAGFMRSWRVLAALVAPMCLLQAAIADPGVRLLFAPRWYDAIGVLQVLSVGMAFVGVAIPCSSMLQAQGRFRTLFLVALGVVSVAVLLMCAAILDGRAVVFALAASTYYLLSTLAHMTAVLRADRPGLWSTLALLAPPLVCAALAAAAGMLSAAWLGQSRPELVARIAITTVVGGLVYLALSRTLQPAAFHDARRLASPVLRRLGLGA